MQLAEALKMRLFPGRYAICRLEPTCQTPLWAQNSEFCSLTRTPEELSIVCVEESVPEEVRCERGWKMLKLAGPIPFAVTGVVAAISEVLARERIGIFVISTYDTDYVLVQEHAIDAAIAALQCAGCRVAR